MLRPCCADMLHLELCHLTRVIGVLIVLIRSVLVALLDVIHLRLHLHLLTRHLRLPPPQNPRSEPSNSLAHHCTPLTQHIRYHGDTNLVREEALCSCAAH